MRLGVRDLFGDAAAPDAGFNRIIGEEKIRKGKRGREKEAGGAIATLGRGKQSLLVIAAPSRSRMHYL